MEIKNKHVFITGTDTGVGKSIFTAFLALSFLNEGKKVAVSKPVQTGFEKDTDFLARLTDNKIPIFNTYSFKLPAAPLVAAKNENKNIDVKKIISDIRKLEKEYDHVIVEGIGGVAAPITDCVIARSKATKQSHNVKQSGDCFVGTDVPPRNDVYVVADLIKDLNYPLIIVARPSLGTINHTVLAIEYAKQKDLNILGFVISGYDEKTNDPALKTAPDMISGITGVQCLMKLPVIEKLDYDSLAASVGSLSSITPNCLANV